MIPRQKCVNCGSLCDPDVVRYRKVQKLYGPLCKKCHIADLAKRRLEKIEGRKKLCMEALSAKRCVVCGGPIAWRDAYIKKGPNRLPITCCRKCHGAYSKRNNVISKEEAEARVKDAIRSTGHYTDNRTILRTAHIAGKVLTKLGISIAVLTKEVFGISEPRVHAASQRIRQPKSLLCLAEMCEEHTIDLGKLTKSVLRHKDWPFEKRKALLEEIATAYIAQSDMYIGVVRLCRGLGVSYDSLIGNYKLDVLRINNDLGFINKRQSWFEESAYKLLCSVFGSERVSREHIFPDCRSYQKNFVLRFDFYIPDLGVLIEVDGSQHKDENNAYFKESSVKNDEIKERYAKANNLKLIRISTAPSIDFLSRFKSQVLDVLKPVELLEPRPGNAEGNQQPSLERPRQLTLF